MQSLSSALGRALIELEASIGKVKTSSDEPKEKAAAARDLLLPAMARVRTNADSLETMVDSELWPMPTYGDLFWSI